MIHTFKLTHLATIGAFFLIVGLTSCSKSEEPSTPEIEMENNQEEEMNDNGSNEGDGLPAAPTFSIKTNTGNDLKFEQFEGKTLVIFFFGNTCPPCKAVAPDIEKKLKEEFSSNSDFAIIGIDTWDGNAASVTSFKNSTGVTFPLGIEGSAVARAYSSTYDRLVVVNKEGKIAYNGRSVAANNLDDVEKLVKTLLN